ncbi:hypothetical protein COO60DRAFT_586922 [Scenedesmus sp. NREL 46B-D3]|nr:hypothetical protein COO60DRAFT_586922 [Scenedesmus sp. NREL 46B-D3]
MTYTLLPPAVLGLVLSDRNDPAAPQPVHDLAWSLTHAVLACIRCVVRQHTGMAGVECFLLESGCCLHVQLIQARIHLISHTRGCRSAGDPKDPGAQSPLEQLLRQPESAAAWVLPYVLNFRVNPVSASGINCLRESFRICARPALLPSVASTILLHGDHDR